MAFEALLVKLSQGSVKFNIITIRRQKLLLPSTAVVDICRLSCLSAFETINGHIRQILDWYQSLTDISLLNENKKKMFISI